ncbi:hypothetical protein PT282_01000 [Bifidobacterium sp. ESL0763]|uniref:hypothetical protein n=1 Tax=Bifidobacterium sp. ESL0763 TaxID=2983227 RepID=UPI0023F6BA80|nr:hypothetical protein [Bifidobacterium sp. ESL0763]MDF7663260.1 hypothetical protein [Bifidobacterium sp. ESL0763]
MDESNQAFVAQMREMAIHLCGASPKEVSRVRELTYCEPSGQHFFVTVWLFGNNKLMSAMFDPNAPLDSLGRPQDGSVEEYEIKSINNVMVDPYGCVITLKNGRKLELKPECMEGPESFNASANGLRSLWHQFRKDASGGGVRSKDVQEILDQLQDIRQMLEQMQQAQQAASSMPQQGMGQPPFPSQQPPMPGQPW